jgi:hypothetical protein
MDVRDPPVKQQGQRRKHELFSESFVDNGSSNKAAVFTTVSRKFDSSIDSDGTSNGAIPPTNQPRQVDSAIDSDDEATLLC